MRAIANIVTLLTAVFTLLATSISALGIGLAERENKVIDTTLTVEACSTGYDCTMAAAWWADCQNAHALGMPQDPSSSVRWCLCPPARSVPNHADWFAKLRNCILCVEMVVGDQGPGGYLSSQLETLAGSPNSFIGYCHNSFDTATFVQKTRDLVAAKKFPLVLPEVIQPSKSAGMARDTTVIPLTTSMSTGPSSFMIPVASSSSPTLPHFPPSDSCESSKTSASHTYTAVQSASVAAACSHDNCLRQAIRFAPTVSSFCASYTRATNTASAGIPKYFSACNNSPARVSSACSCLATYTSSIFQASSTAAPASATKPSIPSSSTHPSSTSSISSSSSSHPVSSAQSTTKSSSPIASAPTLSSRSSSISYSTTKAVTASISSTRSSPSTISQVTPSSSSSSIPHPSKWITLPASDDVRSCAGGRACRYAQIYFNWCMTMKSDTQMWQCLCRTYEALWKANLNTCVACIEDFLPHFSDNPPMLANIKVNVDYFCNYTAPYQAVSRQRLLDEGADLTNMYQSPLELFNMSLIDREYKLGNPQPPAAAPTMTPPLWSSLPASPEVVACSKSRDCNVAGQLFKRCAAEEVLPGQSTFNCLCNKFHDDWYQSVAGCSTCLAEALPNNPASKPAYPKSELVYNAALTQDVFCKSDSLTHNLENLKRAGRVVTGAFQSPISFFGMDIIENPIPFPPSYPKAN